MTNQAIKFYLPIMALILVPAQGFTAEDVFEMGTMTVTATKSEKNIDGVTASVEIITSKEIQTIGAANLKDIFEKTPGLSLQYGTFPAASSASKSSVSIRGLGGAGTLFLIDGRRMAGEVKNPYDLDRIPAGMVERIEIIKGPMSVLYGADATGGVINIITKQPEKAFAGSINVRGGTNKDGDGSMLNGDVSVRGKSGKFGYSVYVDVLNTDSYTERENTRTRIKTPNGLVPPSRHPSPAVNRIKDSYDVDVSYREESDVFTIGGRSTYEIFESTVVGVEFNYFTEERDGDYRSAFFPTGISPAPGKRIPAFDTPVHSHDDNWRRDIGLDLSSNLSSDLTLNLRVYNSFYEKRNTTTALNWQDAGFQSQAASENLGMSADVDIWSYEAYAVYAPGESHLLTGGGEYRDEQRDATVFNQRGTFETRDVDYTAVYLQDEWQITDSLSATFGGRYDVISNADNKATFKVGLVNKFDELCILRVNFAQGYRTPDIRELYIRKNTPAGAQRGSSVADPMLGKQPFDLEPEFVNTYELGLSGRKNGFHYSAALFYNDIADKIEKVTKNPGTPRTYFTFENISDATTKGIELAVGYDFEFGLGLDLNWYELDTENDQTGKDLEFNPDRQVSATVSFRMDRFEVWAMGKYVGKQYAPQAQSQWVDSYFTVDAGASYALGQDKEYELYGGVNNIFDESVDKLIGSNVGPYFFAGLRVNF
ncbi:MAG TPA: TonB-dependent receptor [Thermodesulfobacteriaceae bacterium]|nr:TonB-dependent receptor [Thermodesulfobacteriaceae bacterium]